jgi:hypothetical protein
MQKYKHIFDTVMGIKGEPNDREILWLEKAEHYIAKLSKIPWVEMIAIVNSLSMYATHEDSDIDLLIVTQPRMIWFVRFFATAILWAHGVWRHGEEVAGNFCLSFYITTEALDLREIAIEEDIYLYYWIHYLMPIYDKNQTYEKFVRANECVDSVIPGLSRNPAQSGTTESRFLPSTWEEWQKRQDWGKQRSLVLRDVQSWTQDHRSWDTEDINVQSSKFKVQNKVSEIPTFSFLLSPFYSSLNSFIRLLWFPKTMRKYKKLWKPEGVIISDSMLKFHDQDRRLEIRDTILEKYFDK